MGAAFRSDNGEGNRVVGLELEVQSEGGTTTAVHRRCSERERYGQSMQRNEPATE